MILFLYNLKRIHLTLCFLGSVATVWGQIEKRALGEAEDLSAMIEGDRENHTQDTGGPSEGDEMAGEQKGKWGCPREPLPNELIWEICLRLDPKTLGEWRLIHSDFRDIIDSEGFKRAWLDLNAAGFATDQARYEWAIKGWNAVVLAYLLESEPSSTEYRISYEGRTLTLFQIAAIRGDVAIAEKLLRCGASFENRYWLEAGQTPLQLALVGGTDAHMQIVEMLKAAGGHESLDAARAFYRAQSRFWRRYGMEGMQTFTHLNEEALDRALGGFVDRRDEDGNTFLHKAVKAGQLEMVQTLLNRGANIYARDNNGQTALHLAVEQGNVEGNEEMVQLLLNRGANPHARDNNGQTALHLTAAQHANEEMVQLLLDQGVNIHERDNNGQTALHLAAREHRVGVVQLLLNRRANLRGQDNAGQTALHVAAWRGHIKVMQVLLEAELNVNEQDDEGQTALHVAVMRGDTNVLQWLVEEAGADIWARDNEGRTVLDVAIANRRLNSAMRFDCWTDVAAARRLQYDMMVDYLNTVLAQRQESARVEPLVENEADPVVFLEAALNVNEQGAENAENEANLAVVQPILGGIYRAAFILAANWYSGHMVGLFKHPRN